MQRLAPLLSVRTAVVAATAPLVWHVGLAAGDDPAYGLWRSPAEDREIDQAVFRRGTVAYSEEFDLYARSDESLSSHEAAYAVYALLVEAVDGVDLALGADALGRPLAAMRASLALVDLMQDLDDPAYGHAVVRLDATIRSA